MRIINNSVSRDKAMLFINNNDGRFLVEIQTELCKLKTIYQNLKVNDEELGNVEISVGATINLKHLSLILKIQ